MPLLPYVDYQVSNPLSGDIVINNDQGSLLTLFTISTSAAHSVTVEYSIIRSTTVETGRILIASDGTELGFEIDKTNNGDTGVTLVGSLSGGIISIQYLSTNTGQMGTFRYSQFSIN